MDKKLTWVPDEFNIVVPSAARMYDYVLGGAHNFKVDREAAERLLAAVPARDMVRLNRGFLRRAILFLVEAGIRQFLDLGSGIPTVDNVHEIAQEADPSCRVLYVDIEPITVAHSQLLLAGNGNAAVIRADLRQPQTILDSPEAHRLLDLTQPLGLIMVEVMQFVPDSDDPWSIVAGYRERLARGSYLALSHFTPDGMPERMAQAVEVFKSTQEPAYPRTHAEVMRLFDGFELVEPGLVYTAQWRPESPQDPGAHPHHSNLYAAVGQKL
ncbi:MAG: SAM-dependent methyltransferase [Pseudonocardiales bacterium]|nr:SAM-dependent methyltransferase [Pseudonocardiales bacterium]